MSEMGENRQARLHALLHSLDSEERMWLARQLLGSFRSGVLPARNMREDLLAAELWLRGRIEENKIVAVRQARSRLWLIFMLLRYGALRPSEIMALSTEDFALQEGMLTVSGASMRHVPLPLDAAASMRQIFRSLPRGHGVFRCDPAQLRRSLRECAKACGIAPGSLSPRSLRKNRAAELELAGLPYSLISLFLGRTGREPALAWSFDNPWEMLKNHIQAGQGIKTSARNVFQGKVSKIRQRGILTEITIAAACGFNVLAVITRTSFKNLALCEGKQVNALVKAPFVSVVLAECLEEAVNSPDNCFRGKITEIHADDAAEEILTTLPEGSIVCALYSGGARPPQGLIPGAEVFVCFSPLSVILTAG